MSEQKLMLIKYSVSTKTVFEIDALFLKKAKTSIYFTRKRKSKKDYIYSFESYSEVVVVFLNKKLFSL